MKENNMEIFKFVPENSTGEVDLKVFYYERKPYYSLKDLCKLLNTQKYTFILQKLERANMEEFILDTKKIKLIENVEEVLIGEPGVLEILTRTKRNCGLKLRRWIFECVIPETRFKCGYDTFIDELLKNPNKLGEILINYGK